RLMQISEENGEKAAFYNYYQLFKSLLVFNENLANDCHYLAAYVYLRDSRFDEAEAALSLIPEESDRYLKARYLQGLILVNQNDYDGAIELYEEISKKGDEEFRSKALLQLGYLHYETGQYKQALACFNQVSPESYYADRALLAAAWANFNQKKYDKAIDYVDYLVENYSSSETSYEAMMLSAHNKKLLNQNVPASRDLSFISNSSKALELSKRYYAERDLIVSQLNDLDRLEEEVIEQHNQSMYNFISELRFKLENALRRFEFHGTADGIMYEELQNERKAILEQIGELERIIAEAHANGNRDIARQAAQQRMRLVKALEVYQDRPFSVDYFSDYPLAVNEGATLYQKEVQTKLLSESAKEKQKIMASLSTIASMRAGLQHDPEHRAIGTDLAVLESQLNDLATEVSQVSSWFGENQIDLLETDFNSYADFSGFGLSNSTFSAIDATEEKISRLSQNINYIGSLIEEWQGELEQRELAQKKRIELEARKRFQGKIEAEKQDKEQYFKKNYFDESEREKGESEPEMKKPSGDGNN
ncbi:MAG: tol-pal system YbgF family protein, partial [bacterium]